MRRRKKCEAEEIFELGGIISMLNCMPRTCPGVLCKLSKQPKMPPEAKKKEGLGGKSVARVAGDDRPHFSNSLSAHYLHVISGACRFGWI